MIKNKSVFYIVMVMLIFFCQFAKASDYTIFNPAPDDKLRPLNSERSTKTDSVVTIDAGRVQIETSLVSGVRDKNCTSGSCTKTTQTNFGDTTNIRLGLTQNSDIQFISNLYSNKRVVSGGNLNEKDGFGDSTLRFKYSFAGNKNEKFGLAIIPFIKFPTNQNNLADDDIESGIGAPFAINFEDGWSLGGMTQFNFLKNQNSSYIGYANAVYISKNFTEKFAGIAEIYTYKEDLSGSKWQNTADFIAQYLISKDFKIDGGVNIGLTEAADDLNWFMGFTYRI